MNIDNNEFWIRDWEFFYKASTILWSNVAEKAIVKERRDNYGLELGFPTIKSPWYEVDRLGSELDDICNFLASKWSHLFDAWHTSKNTFVFEDGYSVLFFLRILWANNVVLLRGHYDESWKLTSSLQRAKKKGRKYLAQRLQEADAFASKIKNYPPITRYYSGDIPELHLLAILQHYGYPTDLLDFTYSMDIALFFAENSTSLNSETNSDFSCGSIYALPSNLLPENALLITLPSEIIRPTLQRGVFIANTTIAERKRVELCKYVYRHKSSPVYNSLNEIDFTATVGLSKYILPVFDPIMDIALGINYGEP